jgi:hypothetical protein
MFERTKEWLAKQWGYSTITEAPGAKRDPKKVQIKKVGQALKGRGGGDFETSTVDLLEITKAYNTDSYIRKAVDKYAELMFKAGWDVTGSDQAISDYVWMRLKLMEEATGQSIEDMFKEIAQDLVLYGNAFIVKQRKGNLPPGLKAVGYTGKQPILGYFVLPPTTIKISRDESGKVLNYQQDSGTGNTVDIKPEDMIHVYYKKPRGRAYGIPYIFTVLDDVKMLRQIEENVARLIYKNLFPLYQYKVGLDKPGFEATDEEINDLRDQIREMPMDGAIVLPERHNITVVSAAGAALDADPYLLYFRQRVFSGLGVSDIVMGIGNTANRGTADNLSAEMIDGVKEFQAIFKNAIQSKIVNELLFEGGYDPVVNAQQEVQFVFQEIELDAKMKRENHITQLFTQNAITHEELRTQMGLDPVTDEGRLYFNMVTGALNAQAAQQATQAANNAGQNKNQPANQNGPKPSAGKPKRSKAALDDEDGEEEVLLEQFSPNLLTESSVKVNLHSELRVSQTVDNLQRLWSSYRDDVLNMARQGKSKEQIQGFTMELVKQTVRSRLEKDITSSFFKGIDDAKNILGNINIPSSVYFESDKLKKASAVFADRLANDMKDLLFKALDEQDPVEQVSKIIGAFNSNSYRLDFIAKTELYRSYNYGLALVAKASKLDTVKVINFDPTCKICTVKASEPLNLSTDSLLDAIPPHHPNCNCTIELKT